ncbi:MAG: heavy metal-responsive transcriptional regulator [Caldilineae bacterium]|nr:MAG: heavy metal-responsive transcriptional regulator [Caldilineae bacterium]
MMRIGELAAAVGVRPSTLRYYEQEGLLQPAARSESGYRLYDEGAIPRLRLIQRAQRLGFTLAEVRALLEAWDSNHLSDERLIRLTEERFLALEKEITRLQVLRHELNLFLQDLLERRQARESATAAFVQLMDRVCGDSGASVSSAAMLDWLLQRTGCHLAGAEARTLLERLRGQHIHIWSEQDAYHILVVSQEPEVGRALQKLAELEDHCTVHPSVKSEFSVGHEGYLLVVSGDNAFILVRLFLALEREGVELSEIGS